MKISLRIPVIIIILLFSHTLSRAQSSGAKKYPSVFWEITGNGLQKPSYLFGTMHVSNKLAFHLSDSFYKAISTVDAVALELNPDLWQGQMIQLDKLKQNYDIYTQASMGDYLYENSFTSEKYEDELKAALSTEPSVVNNLLYRSYKSREDFEEDTFLDLYIFQTGKKLGKRSAGVEDFNETEKILLEAYIEMEKEKALKLKKKDTDGESYADIYTKIQDAYKNGDLDLMDSLDLLTENSKAFREKFIYLRNEIQAASIDTILKKSALFVGVGAAHLPGDRGVIELLRKKGYQLRPIQMGSHEPTLKEGTDSLKVPLHFSKYLSDDQFFSVELPGTFFKMTDDNQKLDRRQYADMSNGSYYMVTRVKTNSFFTGQKESQILKKADSFLYENIPGKILKKLSVKKNGYTGLDIFNRTRRGNLQRYQIFVTPFEILVFKMSGKDNYVDGPEADHFFGSIQLKEMEKQAVLYTPEHGGFTAQLPQTPLQYLNYQGKNDTRWEYLSRDISTGDEYLIYQKDIYNNRFLEEDTFMLSLMETSFRSASYFDKQLSRKIYTDKSFPCMDVREKLKDSGYIAARFLIRGPHLYVFAIRSRTASKDYNSFFNSIRLSDFNRNAAVPFTDSFMHFSVTTSFPPQLDWLYREKQETLNEEVIKQKKNSDYSNDFWPARKYASFSNDSTGEIIGVSIQDIPKYYYVTDSAGFWEKEMKKYYQDLGLVLYQKTFIHLPDGVQGVNFSLRDTGSSSYINRTLLLKDDHLYSLCAIDDTLNTSSNSIQQFFYHFKPTLKVPGRNIFINNLDSFFADLLSKDSATHMTAFKAIPDVYFGELGAPKIMSALEHLNPADKDYYSLKLKLIAELGYIKDTLHPIVAGYLQHIYQQTTDTSIFQNEVIKSLARHRTIEAYRLLKEIIHNDPPVFENSTDINRFFNNMKDSLQISATLFPEMLELSSFVDYKEQVISLLSLIVKKGYLTKEKYEKYFNQLYFDARIEWKKQLAKDERKKEKETKKEDENAIVYTYQSDQSMLPEYLTVLIPFYHTNPNIPKFVNQVLKTKDDQLRMKIAVLLATNHIPVADSIFNFFAEKDKYRSGLYMLLQENKILSLFPSAYNHQEAIARSLLVNVKNYNKVDSVVLVGKQTVTYRFKKGVVYFFKYRIKADDEWKIGISGMQPENKKEVSVEDKFIVMTDKKIKTTENEMSQFQVQLKRYMFRAHKSSKYFYKSDSGYSHYAVDSYEER